MKELPVYLTEGDAAPVEVLPPPSPRKNWSRRGLAGWLVKRLGPLAETDNIATENAAAEMLGLSRPHLANALAGRYSLSEAKVVHLVRIGQDVLAIPIRLFLTEPILAWAIGARGVVVLRRAQGHQPHAGSGRNLGTG